MTDAASAGDAGTATGGDAGGQTTDQTTQQQTTQTQQQQGSWVDGLPTDELKGWIQNRGYHELKPEEALGKISDGFWNLEKKMGVPADRLLRLPERLDDADEMKSVYDRLGRPEAPDQYGFKVPEGTDADEGFLKWAGETFHGLGLSKEQGQHLLNAYIKYQGEVVGNEENTLAEDSQAQHLALQKEWGNAYQQNQRIAAGAAQQLGVSGDDIDAIQNALGFDRTMKLFHSIGTRTMEPSLAHGDGAGAPSGGVLTPEQAKAEIEQLKHDPDFRKKFNDGGPNSKEMQRWTLLHSWANPDDSNAQVVRI